MEKKNKLSLLERWKNKEKEGINTPIQKLPEGINIPLSSGQKRLWFLQQLYPNNPFIIILKHMPLAENSI